MCDRRSPTRQQNEEPVVCCSTLMGPFSQTTANERIEDGFSFQSPVHALMLIAQTLYTFKIIQGNTCKMYNYLLFHIRLCVAL